MIAMASTIAARQRRRGRVETLPSGALRVTVYAGVDPLSNRRMYLRETVPAGPRAAGEAEKVRTRLLNQVDEKRNPRTTATVNQLIDRWLEVIDIEASTKQGYVRKIGKHIRPVLGTMQVAKLDAEILESFTPSCGNAATTVGAGSTSSTARLPSTCATSTTVRPAGHQTRKSAAHVRGRAASTSAEVWRTRVFGRFTGSSAACWTGRSDGDGSPSTQRGRRSRQRCRGRTHVRHRPMRRPEW
jgi:hypothetical protein